MNVKTLALSLTAALLIIPGISPLNSIYPNAAFVEQLSLLRRTT